MNNLPPSVKIHALSDVASNNIGEGTVIWQFTIVLSGAVIGSHCNINCHTFIENDVIVGNDVTVKAGVYLWDGLRIEDNVFIGPAAAFTNDRYPRSKQYPEEFQQTLVRTGATIGANATILGGIEIGKYAIVGAGAVVTRSVPDFAIVAGNPANIRGWVDEKGEKMQEKDGLWENTSGKKFQIINNQLVAI